MDHPIYKHIERRRIYLFRHAEAINSKASNFDYPGDIPLTENGQAQARTTGEFIKDVHFDIAFCSDYLRAMQTAQGVLGENRLDLLETNPLFREVDTDFKKILAEASDIDEAVSIMADALRDMPEKFHEVMAAAEMRAAQGIEFLLEKQWSTALLAAHGGFNRILICHLLKLPLKCTSLFEQDYVGMSILDLDVDKNSNRLVRAVLSELNVTAYNPAKNNSLLLDIEKVALETKPLMEKMFQ